MKRIIVLTLALILNAVLQAQSSKDSISIELSALMNKSHLAGFGAAIIDENGIVYAKGFGFADTEKKEAYSIHTVQPIASISKTLLAVALMKAQEMGKLKLSDSINTYLPFRIFNPNFPEQSITVQQLANHTSSIVDGEYYDKTYVFENKFTPFYKNFEDNDLKDELEKWVKMFNANKMMPLKEFIKKQYVKDEIWYDAAHNFSSNYPGSVYKYSNMGANIAAYIIEQATGENYHEFVKKHILIPLHMTGSGWKGKGFEPKNASKLYWYGYPMPFCDLVSYPDGNFMTSLVDYGKFFSTMIQGYKGDANILSSKSYMEMMKNPVSADFRKGIFWSVDSEKIGHSGSDLGLLTHAYFLKANGVGVLVFVNTSDTENASTEVRDIYRILIRYAKKQK